MYEISLKRKLLLVTGATAAIAIGYFWWVNVGIFVQTPCVSNAPCKGYKDLFGAYYYANVGGTGYLIGRRAYLDSPGNKVYITSSHVFSMGNIFIVNMQPPRIPYDGSSGKAGHFNARLEFSADELHFNTRHHQSVSLKL